MREIGVQYSTVHVYFNVQMWSSKPVRLQTFKICLSYSHVRGRNKTPVAGTCLICHETRNHNASLPSTRATADSR